MVAMQSFISCISFFVVFVSIHETVFASALFFVFVTTILLQANYRYKRIFQWSRKPCQFDCSQNCVRKDGRNTGQRVLLCIHWRQWSMSCVHSSRFCHFFVVFIFMTTSNCKHMSMSRSFAAPNTITMRRCAY